MNTVYRVIWVPGSDELIGQCHCGAEHIAQDPIDVWAWLLAHPDGHDMVSRLDADRVMARIRS